MHQSTFSAVIRENTTLGIALFFMCLLAANCAAPSSQSAQSPADNQTSTEPTELDAISAAPIAPKVQPTSERETLQADHRIEIGNSVEGNPIFCTTHGSKHSGRTTLIVAGIHGDEPAGTTLLDELAQRLRNNPAAFQNSRIILIPNANPDGLDKQTRRNANGVDLNRNFPADNRINSRRFGRSALSEPEAQAIYDAIAQYEPDQIISIHQMPRPGGIDYDGPAEQLAMAMAEAGPLRIRRLGAKPGSLGSYASMVLEIPIITLELPQGAEQQSPAELYEGYGPLLLAALSPNQGVKGVRGLED